MTLEASTRLPPTDNNNSTSIGPDKHSRQRQNDGEQLPGSPQVWVCPIKARFRLAGFELLNQYISTPFLQEKKLKCVIVDVRFHNFDYEQLRWNNWILCLKIWKKFSHRSFQAGSTSQNQAWVLSPVNNSINKEIKPITNKVQEDTGPNTPACQQSSNVVYILFVN